MLQKIKIKKVPGRLAIFLGCVGEIFRELQSVNEKSATCPTFWCRVSWVFLCNGIHYGLVQMY